jgi:phospholipid/cholesterol/gamma-HCH transport system substrate-binding protein
MASTLAVLAGRFTTAAKVGVFAVVLVGAGLFIYRYVTKSGDGDGGYVVFARMKDASGIAKLSQVRIAGIPVGRVKSIKLDHDIARIDMSMNKDVPLYEDAAVSKVASSLLGEFQLKISPGTEGRRKLVTGDEIKVVSEAQTPDDLMRQMSDIAKDVKEVTAALRDSVGSDQGKQDISATLRNLAQVTEALNETVRENRTAIHEIVVNTQQISARSAPEIQTILENVRETTREVRELVAKDPTGTGKEAGEVRKIVERVDRASQNLESALKNVDDVTARLNRGEGTLGRLTKDEKLINEVEGAVENVGDFLGGISRLQTIVSLRTDYQFLASTVKSYVEIRLQPKEDKYYMIEIVNDPKGLTRFEQTDVDTTNPNDPPHYREVRTVTTNSLRFSLQFAQSFGPFTGRFGIKESTGGLGLDTSLFDDRFELRQDLYGFGEVVLPRWRISLGYEFINRLWLLGGVEDILSNSRRDYFVGGMLRFNDEDLKTILPFAKTPGG